MKKLSILLLTLLLIATTLTGCITIKPDGEDGTTPDTTPDTNLITKLELSSVTPVFMTVGESKRLWVSLTPINGDKAKVTFVSENESIAKVEKDTDAIGAIWFKISAIGSGSTKVYAKTESGIESEKLTIGVTNPTLSAVVETLVSSKIDNKYKDDYFFCTASTPGSQVDMVNISIQSNHNSFNSETVCKDFVTALVTSIINDANYKNINSLSFTFSRSGTVFAWVDINTTLVTTVDELSVNIDYRANL